MRGQPVWLGSISRGSGLAQGPVAVRHTLPSRQRDGVSGGRFDEGRLSTQLWSKRMMDESIALLRQLLGPVGNPERERIFRMQITTCIHRALTDEEVAALPEYFRTDPATDSAGGPVEVLWESEEGALSTRPCARPTRANPPGNRNPLIWVPLDCGECDSCRARAVIDHLVDVKTAALKERWR